MAAPFECVRYTPHARQLALHEAAEPDLWFAAGYAVGKSTAAVFEALNLAAITHPGYAGIVAAPTFPLLWQSWLEEWRRWIPSTWYELKGGSTAPYIALRTDQGESKIWLRSTVDAASLEGINAAWLVYDEATRERSPDPIRVLKARLRRGYPGRQRRTVLIGPPSTRTHWTAVMFGTGPGQGGRTGDHLSWSDRRRRVVRARTRDNPHLPPGFEEDLRTRPGATKAWIKQWLDAQFGVTEGQIYETFDRDVHVVPAAELADRTWRDVILAVDWGWAHPGVALVLALDGRGDVYVLAEEVHKGKVVADTPDGWIPILRELVRTWRVKRLFADPSRPGDLEVVARALRKHGVNSYPTDNNVTDGIRRVQALLEWGCVRAASAVPIVGHPALYIADACPRTIGGFEGYVRRKQRDGSFSEDPEKRDDDEMDTLRYGVMELSGAV